MHGEDLFLNNLLYGTISFYLHCPPSDGSFFKKLRESCKFLQCRVLSESSQSQSIQKSEMNSTLTHPLRNKLKRTKQNKKKKQGPAWLLIRPILSLQAPASIWVLPLVLAAPLSFFFFSFRCLPV